MDRGEYDVSELQKHFSWTFEAFAVSKVIRQSHGRLPAYVRIADGAHVSSSAHLNKGTILKVQGTKVFKRILAKANFKTLISLDYPASLSLYEADQGAHFDTVHDLIAKPCRPRSVCTTKDFTVWGKGPIVKAGSVLTIEGAVKRCTSEGVAEFLACKCPENGRTMALQPSTVGGFGLILDVRKYSLGEFLLRYSLPQQVFFCSPEEKSVPVCPFSSSNEPVMLEKEAECKYLVCTDNVSGDMTKETRVYFLPEAFNDDDTSLLGISLHVPVSHCLLAGPVEDALTSHRPSELDLHHIADPCHFENSHSRCVYSLTMGELFCQHLPTLVPRRGRKMVMEEVGEAAAGGKKWTNSENMNQSGDLQDSEDNDYLDPLPPSIPPAMLTTGNNGAATVLEMDGRRSSALFLGRHDVLADRHRLMNQRPHSISMDNLSAIPKLPQSPKPRSRFQKALPWFLQRRIAQSKAKENRRTIAGAYRSNSFENVFLPPSSALAKGVNEQKTESEYDNHISIQQNRIMQRLSASHGPSADMSSFSVGPSSSHSHAPLASSMSQPFLGNSEGSRSHYDPYEAKENWTPLRARSCEKEETPLMYGGRSIQNGNINNNNSGSELTLNPEAEKPLNTTVVCSEEHERQYSLSRRHEDHQSHKTCHVDTASSTEGWTPSHQSEEAAFASGPMLRTSTMERPSPMTSSSSSPSASLESMSLSIGQRAVSHSNTGSSSKSSRSSRYVEVVIPPSASLPRHDGKSGPNRSGRLPSQSFAHRPCQSFPDHSHSSLPQPPPRVSPPPLPPPLLESTSTRAFETIVPSSLDMMTAAHTHHQPHFHYQCPHANPSCPGPSISTGQSFHQVSDPIGSRPPYLYLDMAASHPMDPEGPVFTPVSPPNSGKVLSPPSRPPPPLPYELAASIPPPESSPPSLSPRNNTSHGKEMHVSTALDHNPETNGIVFHRSEESDSPVSHRRSRLAGRGESKDGDSHVSSSALGKPATHSGELSFQESSPRLSGDNQLSQSSSRSLSTDDLELARHSLALDNRSPCSDASLASGDASVRNIPPNDNQSIPKIAPKPRRRVSKASAPTPKLRVAPTLRSSDHPRSKVAADDDSSVYGGDVNGNGGAECAFSGGTNVAASDDVQPCHYASLAEVPANMSGLSVGELEVCLRLHKLPRASAAFRREMVDGSLFMSMSESDLRDTAFSFSNLEVLKLTQIQKGWKVKY